MDLMNATLSRVVALEIDGVDARLTVTRVHATEGVHRPFAVEVTVAVDGDLDLSTLVGQPAKVTWQLGADRTFEGRIEEVELQDLGMRVVVAPLIAMLGDAVDYQVFVDKDAVAIVEEVLAEHGVSVEKRLARTPEPRPQCVQRFESDLDFVARLCSEEGITYFIPGGAADRIVLSDHDSGWEPVPGGSELPVRETGGLAASKESVFELALRHARVTDKVALSDFNYDKPLLDLAVDATDEGESLERYEYPGGYAEPPVGQELAAIRLDQLRARRTTITARTSCPRLAPGHVIELYDPLRDEVGGAWLVLEVVHDLAGGEAGEQGVTYRGRFTAVPADAGYRRDKIDPPVVAGAQTATTTGAGGEIQSDELGRTTMQMRWDRRRPADDTASTPLRVVQPPTSGGFLFPRVGWENLVQFQGRSADTPWVLGRMYNGEAPPPAGLPANDVVGALGTRTTPGGGAGNLVEMNDTAGKEAMSFVASKDFNERTENDKNTNITADDGWTVGANRQVIVGQVLSETIGSSQTYSIGGNRTLNVGSDMFINAGSESILIGGLRTFDVGGDYKTSCSVLTRLVGGAKVEAGIEHVVRNVKGAQTVVIGGNLTTVAGASFNFSASAVSNETVAGAKSIKASKLYMKVRGPLAETYASRSITAGGDRQEGFGGAASYTIAGGANLKASAITVKATSKITLKAGGATITIDSSSITVSASYKSSVNSADVGDEDYAD